MEKLILIVGGIMMSFCLSAQEQEPRIYSGSRSISDPITIPSEENIVSLPDNAIQSYEKGSAPFYAQLNFYAGMLNRSIQNGRNSLLEHEAEELNIELFELEEIVNTLILFSDAKVEMWHSEFLLACDPVFRDQPISNEYAREAISYIGDNTDRLNILAEEAIEDVSNNFDNSLIQALRARIDSWGQTISFTKVDQAEQVNFLHEGDFQTWFIHQCEAY